MDMESDYNYYNESELQQYSKLILYIEEVSGPDYSIIERRIFIGWDKDSSMFFVRGMVQNSENVERVPFSFTNGSRTNVYNLVKFIVDKSPVNIVLYNYNNLYNKDIDSLPYDFFEYLLNKTHEIAGYDADIIQREQFMNLLKLLKM
jgi:hypothetical protein